MQIYIIPLDYADIELLEKLSLNLSQQFRMSVEILEKEIDLQGGWSYERDQLHSSWVLTQLKQIVPDTHSKILGITKTDLYIPILTYLFGEAELTGQTAVVSSFRFHNRLYGLPPDNNLMNNRIIKEAVHELGHTFGLHHCVKFDCVMHASSYIEEFDFKSKNFCTDCQQILNKLLPNH